MMGRLNLAVQWFSVIALFLLCVFYCACFIVRVLLCVASRAESSSIKCQRLSERESSRVLVLFMTSTHALNFILVLTSVTGHLSPHYFFWTGVYIRIMYVIEWWATAWVDCLRATIATAYEDGASKQFKMCWLLWKLRIDTPTNCEMAIPAIKNDEGRAVACQKFILIPMLPCVST